MGSEYMFVCTVLGLKCCQKLRKFCDPRDKSQSLMDDGSADAYKPLAEDAFVDDPGRVRQFLLN